MSWDQFIELVKSKYPVEVAEYFTVVHTDPSRRVYTSLVGAGNLEFLEFLAPLGHVQSFDLDAAFASVNEKLCGLTVVDGSLTAKLTVPMRGFDMNDWSWPFQIMNVWIGAIPEEAARR